MNDVTAVDDREQLFGNLPDLIQSARTSGLVGFSKIITVVRSRMGHEVVLFGCIEGIAQDACLELNRNVLEQLPERDGWPGLVRGMFAMPVEWPVGTYQSHIIHFGASFKDEPGVEGFWDTWLNKFESLLRQLHWYSATLHLKIEFGPDEVHYWRPVTDTNSRSIQSPAPIRQWERSVRAFR